MTTIVTAIENGVARITLNRPEKLNSFAGSMREELIAALQRIADDENVRVVIVTGAGRAFSAGGDVERMRNLQKERDEAAFGELLAAGRKAVTLIRRMPQFVIAAVNGVAAGAGCNLALACDYRIAADTAKLGETFVRIGLHPDWGGTFFLPRLVGTSRAMEIMMTGRMVDADEAVRIGMVDRVVAAGELSAETTSLARSVADGPALVLSALKRALYASADNDLPAQIDLEGDIQRHAFRSPDAAEGMTAFFEKRAPEFGPR
jgi:2-(1,2-epoxy-1,2-dihydrophenyl)acetyl-CoA isomerase